MPPSDSTHQNSTCYSITDRIEHISCIGWTGNVTVTAEFTMQDDGVTTIRDAPLGFTIKERWAIQEQSGGEDKPTTRNVLLDVTLEAGQLILPFFKRMMEKNHEGYMDGMMQLLLEKCSV